MPSVFVELRATILDFQAKMAAARAEMDATAKSGANSFDQIGKVGAVAFAAVGAAAIATGVLSVKAAMDFQSSMLMIQTQAGASATEVAKMSAALVKMGPEVAQSPLALAKALYPIESVGLRGAAALDVLKSAAQGAAVGHADLTATASALASVMQSGITGIHGAADAMGVMNAIVGNGKMYMQDLVSAMGSGVMSSAQVFGVSLQSVGAAMDVMTNAGVPADTAATRLRMTMALLAAPTKMAAGILHDLGLSSTDAAMQQNAMAQMLAKSGVTTTKLASDLRQPDGFMVALADLKKHMTDAGLSAEEQSAVIARAFGGSRSSGGIMALYSNLDGLQSKFNDINKGAGGFGAAWEATTHTLKFQFDQLYASTEAWLIQLGTKLIPIVSNAIQSFRDFIVYLQKHHDVGLELAAAIGGPLLVAMGLWIVSLFTADGALAFLLGPVGAVLLAVAALSAGVMFLWLHWDQVWNWIKEHKAYAAIIAVVAPFVPLLIGLVAIARYVADNWQTIWADIQKYTERAGVIIQQVWSDIKQWTNTAVTAITPTLNNLRDIWNRLWIDIPRWAAEGSAIIQHVWADIKQWTNDAVVFITPVLNFLASTWNMLWRDIPKWAGDASVILQRVWADIKQWTTDGVNIVSGIVRTLANVWNTVFGAIRNFVTDHIKAIEIVLAILVLPITLLVAAGIFLWNNWRTIWGAIQDIVKVAWGIIKPIWDLFYWAVTTFLVLGFQILRAVVEVEWAAISNLIKAAWDHIVKPVFDAIKWTVENVLAPVMTWLWHNIFEPTFQSISSQVSTAWDVMKTVFNDMKWFVENVLAPVFNWLADNVIGPAWDSITSVTEAVWNGITDIIGTAINDTIDIINFFIRAIDTVLTLIPGVHAISELQHVPGSGHAAAATHVAGAHFAASGGITRGPAMIVGEGNPAFPEYIIPTDPAHRSNALNLWGGVAKDMGIPGFDSGGVFGFIGGALSGVADLAKNGLDAIRNGTVDALVAPALSAADLALGKLGIPFIDKLPDLLFGDIITFLKGQKDKVGGGPLLDMAKMFLGVPYVWGGGHGAMETVAQAMISGLDCSGLVDQAAFAAHMSSSTGIYGTTYNQQRAGTAVADLAHAMPGDLLLYAAQALGESHHVGIYAGSGQMINAEMPGTNVKMDSAGVPQYIRHVFDQGGWLHPGLTMAWNGTGQSERVVGPGNANGGGVTYVMNFYGPVIGQGGMKAVAEQVRVELLRKGRSQPTLGLS